MPPPTSHHASSREKLLKNAKEKEKVKSNSKRGATSSSSSSGTIGTRIAAFEKSNNTNTNDQGDIEVNTVVKTSRSGEKLTEGVEMESQPAVAEPLKKAVSESGILSNGEKIMKKTSSESGIISNEEKIMKPKSSDLGVISNGDQKIIKQKSSDLGIISNGDQKIIKQKSSDLDVLSNGDQKIIKQESSDLGIISNGDQKIIKKKSSDLGIISNGEKIMKQKSSDLGIISSGDQKIIKQKSSDLGIISNGAKIIKQKSSDLGIISNGEKIIKQKSSDLGIISNGEKIIKQKSSDLGIISNGEKIIQQKSSDLGIISDGDQKIIKQKSSESGIISNSEQILEKKCSETGIISNSVQNIEQNCSGTGIISNTEHILEKKCSENGIISNSEQIMKKTCSETGIISNISEQIMEKTCSESGIISNSEQDLKKTCSRLGLTNGEIASPKTAIISISPLSAMDINASPNSNDGEKTAIVPSFVKEIASTEPISILNSLDDSAVKAIIPAQYGHSLSSLQSDDNVVTETCRNKCLEGENDASICPNQLDLEKIGISISNISAAISSDITPISPSLSHQHNNDEKIDRELEKVDNLIQNSVSMKKLDLGMETCSSEQERFLFTQVGASIDLDKEYTGNKNLSAVLNDGREIDKTLPLPLPLPCPFVVGNNGSEMRSIVEQESMQLDMATPPNLITLLSASVDSLPVSNSHTDQALLQPSGFGDETQGLEKTGETGYSQSNISNMHVCATLDLSYEPLVEGDLKLAKFAEADVKLIKLPEGDIIQESPSATLGRQNPIKITPLWKILILFLLAIVIGQFSSSFVNLNREYSNYSLPPPT